MKISQREAHRLRKRVMELEQRFNSQNRRWNMDWPASTLLHRTTGSNEALTVIRTARALGVPVVVTVQNEQICLWGER